MLDGFTAISEIRPEVRAGPHFKNRALSVSLFNGYYPWPAQGFSLCKQRNNNKEYIIAMPLRNNISYAVVLKNGIQNIDFESHVSSG
jgi:hypothetical protein